jgi:hypothetical protein
MSHTPRRIGIGKVMFVVGFFVAGSGLGRPEVAHAEAAAAADPEALAKVTQLNRDAVAAYQAKSYDEARNLLRQALELADSSGLESHPIKARTYVHMGIVLVAGLKQRGPGIQQFQKALAIQPEIGLTKGLVTPELQAAFDEAKNGPPAKPATPPPPPPAPTPTDTGAKGEGEVPSTGIVHEPVREGKQGSAISITVGVQSDLKFDKLVLAYRPEGASEFLGREMREVREGTYAAEIPPSATTGNVVAYYVEADDKDGAPVAARGSADSPLTIALARAGSGGGGGGRASATKDEDEDEDEDEEGGGRGKLYVGLTVGSGAGWATGKGDVNADVTIKPAGIAWARLAHVAPEVGYWISPKMMISLAGRLQVVNGTTDVTLNNKTYHAANYAAAVFARLTFITGSGSFHPFISVAAGGGNIRHVVTFRPSLIGPANVITGCGSDMKQGCIDTISSGPILVGPGGGFMLDLGKKLAFVFQLNTQLGVPKFTFNVDGNLGAAMRF